MKQVNIWKTDKQYFGKVDVDDEIHDFFRSENF